ncbi:TauD/TfdA family dioxygenase [Aurantiacibacter flavus]|uniref:TauD/TfdA family dioxygenase n=1 Tax=Aurantiacibacter flavus TaxID=3145232 RepID=A0ABV0CRW1_9SPHN
MPLIWDHQHGKAQADRAVRDIIQKSASGRECLWVGSHQWRQGDLVIRDNRCPLHRACPFDFQSVKRDLRRATISENGPEISAVEANPGQNRGAVSLGVPSSVIARPRQPSGP